VEITVHFAARAIDTVRAVAAAEILPRFRSVAAGSAGASQPPARKDDGSVVTEADMASQDALIHRLRALEPLPVIAEEMPSHEQLAVYERGGRYWCVDPLDGTRNFSEGVPFFAVSVALMEDAMPLFGIVYDPIADEAFYAVRGAGAWMNRKALVLGDDAPALAQAVAEVSLRRDTARLKSALRRSPPFARRLASGSSALSWCHLAAARTDVLLHSGQKMWDWAAGSLILAEAHGALRALDDADFWASGVWARSVIAARTPALLAQWEAWILAHLHPAGEGS
jgi:myo-inositol-1(or 4)-monophosphatase